MQAVCNEACKATLEPLSNRVGELEAGQHRLEKGQESMEAKFDQMLDRMQKIEQAVGVQRAYSGSAGLLATPMPKNVEPDVTTIPRPGSY